MSDEIKLSIRDHKNGRVTIHFTLETEYLNSRFSEVLEYFFGVDYLAALKKTTEDKTLISIETEKGRVLTYLNQSQGSIVETETLKKMLGICHLENRDN